MTSRTITITLLLAGLLSICGPEVYSCDFPPSGFENHSKDQKYTGHYSNAAWGYGVTIPRSMAGYDGAEQPSHHGFGMTIGAEPKSYITMNGEANSLDYESPVDVALKHLSFLRSDQKQIQSIQITSRRLGNLPAAEMIVTYSCPESPERYTMSAVFALGPGKGPVYEAILYSRAYRYLSDRRVFDEMLKSWRYTGY
jgi:hypothetical protein